MLKKTAVNFDFAREGIIFSDHLVYSAFGSVSMRPASLGSPPVVEANEPTNLHSESRCYAAAGLLLYVPPSSVAAKCPTDGLGGRVLPRAPRRGGGRHHKTRKKQTIDQQTIAREISFHRFKTYPTVRNPKPFVPEARVQ